MTNDIDDLAEQNKSLLAERDELLNKLQEAKEIIAAIKKGNIDAVFIADDNTTKVLVSETADQSYRMFIENMSEGVVTVYTDGTILYSNSSFARMVKLPLERVIGVNLRNFIPYVYEAIFEDFFDRFQTSNSTVELSTIDSKGASTYFTVSLNRIQLQDVEALNLVWTNVTIQKETEGKLITLNEDLQTAIDERIDSENKVLILNERLKSNIKMLEDTIEDLGTFAYIASHDLQEPLRKITTYSSMLIRKYGEVMDQQGQLYLNNLQNAAQRMRNLINDILQYSELSRLDILVQPVSLHRIFKEVIKDLRVVSNELNADIKLQDDLPVIEANPDQMRQLFRSIISNSIKFRQKGITPEIIINSRIVPGREIVAVPESMSQEQFCILTIKDNGIGFDQIYNHQIFTIFQRLNNNAVYPGTGIGLAICKKIVAKHNGFIAAEGKVNEGAWFTITLPVNQSTLKKDVHKVSQGRTVI
ncbi:MAG: ATP-binding protein [Chitinophagaceae bacterium]